MSGAEARAHPGCGHAHAGSVTDPVCGMTVDPATSRHRFAYGGETYHFCSARCREKFAADPEIYLKPPVAAPAPDGAVYTCPMHPEIRQDRPGTCPICGMALEPELPAAEAESNPELADMRRRFRIGLVFTVPLFFLAMADLIPGMYLERIIPPRWSVWLQLALASPVVLWAGAPFFAGGWASVVRRRLNMFSLIALGVGTAYLYSLIAT